MAISQKIFKPSFLYTYQGGSYKNSNTPVKSAGSPAYTSIIGFPTDAINAIKESKTSAKIYIKWRCTNEGVVAFGAHKKSSNDKQPNIYYTYIGLERVVPVGWYTQEVTNASLTNGGYGFKTALLSYGYKGLVFYGASGQNYMEGYGITSDSNSMQIIIEGTFDDVPTAPTNLSPSTGRTLDPGANNTFSWKHNGTGLAGTQNGYRIAYRLKPSGSWVYIPSSTGFNSSGSSSHTFAPSTFSLGEYEWYVVTRATNSQVSPASSVVPFNVVSIASAPSITAPSAGAVLTSDLLNVAWTSVNQSYYTLELLDFGGSVIYTEEKAGTAKTTTIAGQLQDNSSYTINLWIENTDGATSAVSTRAFTTQFVRPEKPIINSVTTTDGTDHIINFTTFAREEFINPNAEATLMDYVGKVSASTTVNPHIAKRGAPVGLSNPVTNSPALTELNTAEYLNISTLNAVVVVSGGNSTVSTNVGQEVFSFNLIRHVEENYFAIPGTTTASKVTWLKANISSMAFDWYGWGSSVGGNKATVAMWHSQSNTWYGNIATGLGVVNKVTRTVPTSGDVSAVIDANGMVHFIAYADASDGVASSAVRTDYATLSVMFSSTTYDMVLSYANVYARQYTVNSSKEWFLVEGILPTGAGVESVNYRFPSGGTMEYKVEVLASSGSTNTSDVTQFSTTFEYSYLAVNSDLSNMIPFTVNESRDEEFAIDQQLTKFLGRRSPVPEFGISEDNSLTLGAYFDTYQEVQDVKALSRFRRPLYYRDYSGREMICVIDGGVKTKDLIAGGYEVTLKITEIDSGGFI